MNVVEIVIARQMPSPLSAMTAGKSKLMSSGKHAHICSCSCEDIATEDVRQLLEIEVVCKRSRRMQSN
jgi:hypothetical protein